LFEETFVTILRQSSESSITILLQTNESVVKTVRKFEYLCVKLP